MKLARVTGTVTATVKDGQLHGVPLVLTDVQDASGQTTEAAVVAANACAAGPGDTVLLAFGSAARLPGAVAGLPVDATVVAIVDHVDQPDAGKARRPAPNKRKS